MGRRCRAGCTSCPKLKTAVVTTHRDGWRWEPAMHLPSRWRRKELAYDDENQLRLTA